MIGEVILKSNIRLKLLGWVCTQLPPTLNPGTGRSSSVRHHGTISFLGVNKKLTWKKMRLGVIDALLVFGSIISTLQHEFQAEVEYQNIRDCGLEVIMDAIMLFKLLLAIILQYFEVAL